VATVQRSAGHPPGSYDVSRTIILRQPRVHVATIPERRQKIGRGHPTVGDVAALGYLMAEKQRFQNIWGFPQVPSRLTKVRTQSARPVSDRLQPSVVPIATCRVYAMVRDVIQRQGR
jgi:hypothetical protein